MRLYTCKNSKEQEKAVLEIDNNFYFIDDINKKFNTSWRNKVFDLIKNQEIEDLKIWLKHNEKDLIIKLKDKSHSEIELNFCPLYRHPSKIWGIGLNYVEHAGDLDESAPKGIPASFVKTDTTIIGFDDEIKIPVMSEKTTGEAELGIIIGSQCKNIEEKKWIEAVAGFTTIIDMTAEDILRKNPRYLTVSKNFDSFFSFGPCLITPDEITNIKELEVSTIINGKVHAKNTIKNMTFPPEFLVSFHSKVMTLKPGDIISTGTPRAVHIQHLDSIECRITGFPILKNSVIDLKTEK